MTVRPGGGQVLTIDQADGLAQRAHGDDRNKSGLPFITHVRNVAARLEDDPDDYAVVAALLHDTVEKSRMEFADLRTAGADDRLIGLVDALTERTGEPERSYLARCAADPLALRIKRADIADKFDTAQRADLTSVQRRDLLRRARRRLAILESFASAESPPIAHSRRAT